MFTFRFEPQEITPNRDSVLDLLGIPGDTELRPDIETMLGTSMELFSKLAEPRGIVKDISTEGFAELYPGEGRNAAETPLEDIYPRAEALAMFAVTIGKEISERLSSLFDEKEFAFASMLDAVASDGTDRLAEIMVSRYLAEPGLVERGLDGMASLRYSPGYCGWHVSGQRALFRYLEPGEIGIELLESCLMQPTKSISGVIVSGEPGIHLFDPAFEFCSECTSPTCRERIASIHRE